MWKDFRKKITKDPRILKQRINWKITLKEIVCNLPKHVILLLCFRTVNQFCCLRNALSSSLLGCYYIHDRCYIENGTTTVLCLCGREVRDIAQESQVTELPCLIRSAFNASHGTRRSQRGQGWDRMGLDETFWNTRWRLDLHSDIFLRSTYISVWVSQSRLVCILVLIKFIQRTCNRPA